MPNEVTRIQLQNGLQIMLKEIHTAPLISHWVWYRVGSRNEVPGMRGISHWVEHMLFKGSKRFPGQQLDRLISREGGMWNALTSMDWTTFYETMPSDQIDIAMQIEADRMLNSAFDPQEVESERTVILSEMEGKDNEPLARLSEAVQQAAFDFHPYKHEVIGDAQDLRIISREDLYQHYRRYYHPNNALVTVAGDFNTAEMIDRLRMLYEDIPAGPHVDGATVSESPLLSERQVRVAGPGATTYIEIAYRGPAAGEDDFFPFAVLDSLLTGPMSLNMFGGGGTSNKTSRLYRALVETELAVGAQGGMQATRDPFLYSILAIPHPSRKWEEVLAAIDGQICKLVEQPILSEEITRAAKQARAMFAYGSENITNQAFWMGYPEMYSSYDWFLTYMDRLTQVTPDDVQRIARIYLQPSRRVVGVYEPTGEQMEAAE